MKPEPTEIEVRRHLDRLARERKVSLAGLSRLIGRPDGYLARYVAGGSPKRLKEGERARLANFFDVTRRELGEWDNPDEEGHR